MDIVSFAKKKERKRFKRKVEIKKRLRCHKSLDNCNKAHPYQEKKVLQKVENKKTWKDWLKCIVAYFYRI